MTDFISEIENTFGPAKAKAIQVAGKTVLHEGQFNKAMDMSVKIVGKRW
jgi:hypothetical protein